MDFYFWCWKYNWFYVHATTWDDAGIFRSTNWFHVATCWFSFDNASFIYWNVLIGLQIWALGTRNMIELHPNIVP